MSSRVENKMSVNKMATNKGEKPMMIMYRGNTIDGWLSAYLFFSKYSNSRIVKLWAFDPHNHKTYPAATYAKNYDIYLVNGCIAIEYLEKWIDEYNICICRYFDNHSDAVDYITLIHRSNEKNGECVIEKNENDVFCTSYWDKYMSYDINTSTFKLVYSYLYKDNKDNKDKKDLSWISAMDRIIMWKNLSIDEKAIHKLFHSISVEHNKSNVGDGLKMTRKIISKLFEEESSNKDEILEKYRKKIIEEQENICKLLDDNSSYNGVTIKKLSKTHVNQFNLPDNWIGKNIFMMETANIFIDTTLAADIVFDKYNKNQNSSNSNSNGNGPIDIFINYKIKCIQQNNKNIQYLYYSCRAFKENMGTGDNAKSVNLLDWKLLKGFPLSAAGKYLMQKDNECLPILSDTCDV